MTALQNAIKEAERLRMKVHKWTNNDLSGAWCSRDGRFFTRNWKEVTCGFCQKLKSKGIKR